MGHKIYNKGAFILIFVFIAFLLLKDPYIGLADNTDYYRVIQPLGFETEGLERYYNAYNFYKINGVNNSEIFTSLQNIINPDIENNNDYFSTQFLFIKASMLINYFIKLMLGKQVEIFNLKILGLLYTAVYSYGLYLLLKYIKFKSKALKALFIILTIFVLCDIGYLIYFNSFFGEAPIIATLMLIAGSSLALIKSESNKSTVYYFLIFFISSILFIGAKVANTPVGILIGFFALCLLAVKKDYATKFLIITGSVIIIAFSVFYYASAPKWMSQVNNYQAIFYGILKDSPSPSKDIRDLGISEKYLSLSGTHGFIEQKQFDIYSDEFQHDVYDKASFVNVTKFYLFHPQRLIDKLILSADNSVIIRPSYLGNYEEGDNFERLSFTNRFSAWESMRKKTLGYAFYIIGVYSIIFFIVATVEIIKYIKSKNKIKSVHAIAAMTLFLAAMSQLVLPVIGNGEADLQKHMLLFNICFDMMILAGAAYLMNNYKSKELLKIIPLSAVSILLLLFIAPPVKTALQTNKELKTGDLIQYGTYEDKNLYWTVLKHDENGYLIWCNSSVKNMEFDLKDESMTESVMENNYGSNDWENSDIRKWLNQDFIESFTDSEISLIKNVQLKNVLSYDKIENRDGGNKPYFWTAITTYVDQNYDTDAYYKNLSEQIFLLDTFQLKNFVLNNKINYKQNIRYWLRTPYYSNSSMVRIVDEDGLVYHKDANVKAGIIPAMYIEDDLPVIKGEGTKNNPYIITE